MKRLPAALCLAGGLLLAAGPAVAQRANPATFDDRLEARALAPGVHVVEGDNDDFSPANGCNVISTGFVVADAGVLVINTGGRAAAVASSCAR